MSVSKKVRTFLEENNLIQKEIARRADIPYPAFNAMMTGRRKMHAEDLCAICYALNVKPEVFIETKIMQEAG